MPDPEKTLTEAQVAEAIKWLKVHAPRAKCPFCGSDAWGVDPYLARMELIKPNGHPMGVHYPLFTARCQTCAFTACFNAQQANVLPVADEPAPMPAAPPAAGAKGV